MKVIFGARTSSPDLDSVLAVTSARPAVYLALKEGDIR